MAAAWLRPDPLGFAASFRRVCCAWRRPDWFGMAAVLPADPALVATRLCFSARHRLNRGATREPVHNLYLIAACSLRAGAAPLDRKAKQGAIKRRPNAACVARPLLCSPSKRRDPDRLRLIFPVCPWPDEIPTALPMPCSRSVARPAALAATSSPSSCCGRASRRSHRHAPGSLVWSAVLQILAFSPLSAG